MNENVQVLFTSEEVASRVRQIGSEVAREFQGREICVVGLIKSCMVFMADFVRAVPLDMTCHFLRVSSLRDASSGTAASVTASVATHSTPRWRAWWPALSRPMTASSVATKTRLPRSWRRRRYVTAYIEQARKSSDRNKDNRGRKSAFNDNQNKIKSGSNSSSRNGPGSKRRKSSDNNKDNRSSKSAFSANQSKTKNASNSNSRNGLGRKHRKSKGNSEKCRRRKNASNANQNNGMNAASEKRSSKTVVSHVSNNKSEFISSKKK